MANRVLKELSKDFGKMYSSNGWPAIPPGKLIRSLLLQVLYSIRSERLFLEQLDYNLLFRWFVGLGMDEDVWDLTTFSKSCERLFNTALVPEFFCRIHEEAQEHRLLSDEHFTLDKIWI